MKWRVVFQTFAALVLAALGFRVYGGTRAMFEQFGFRPGPALVGLIVAIAAAMQPLLVLYIVTHLCDASLARRFREGRHAPLFARATVAIVAGALLSEAAIGYDEARFLREVAQTDGTREYWRARAWPNTGCSLGYVPGSGFHATE